MPVELREKLKLMLKSAWQTVSNAYVGKSAWRAALKPAEKVTEQVLFQGHKVTSLKLKRRQCRLQLDMAMNLVLHTGCLFFKWSPQKVFSVSW